MSQPDAANPTILQKPRVEHDVLTAELWQRVLIDPAIGGITSTDTRGRHTDAMRLEMDAIVTCPELRL